MTPPFDSPDQIDTAFHEAGHIAVALHHRHVPLGATIVPDGEVSGAIFVKRRVAGSLDELATWQRLGDAGADLWREAVELLAGAAVDLRRGRQWGVGWGYDVVRARLALRALYADERRAAAELPRAFAAARAIVDRSEVWRAIELIAGELCRRGELARMKMLRLVLKAAPIIHGQARATEDMRSWRGYAELAAGAWRDPLVKPTISDWCWVCLSPIGAAAVLLMLTIH
jgi:hypothetical protein